MPCCMDCGSRLGGFDHPETRKCHAVDHSDRTAVSELKWANHQRLEAAKTRKDSQFRTGWLAGLLSDRSTLDKQREMMGPEKFQNLEGRADAANLRRLEAALGLRLCRKYRRQLGGEML